MGELRKDYFLDEWVIINQKRGLRPHQVAKQHAKLVGTDYFAPGNEEMTPPEIYRVEEKGKWEIRVFPNKFAIVDEKENYSKKRPFINGYSFGKHEVVVEDDDIKKQLWDLSKKRFRELLVTYQKRIQAILMDKKIKYVQVFKNHGIKGGTSILHTHSQIIGLNIVPPKVIELAKKSSKKGKSLFPGIIKKELKGDRKAFENKTMVAFCPWASKFNYEVWIMPKRKVRSMDDFTEQNFDDLAEILRKVLIKLRKINIDYNFVIYYSPKKYDLQFQIRVLPRYATWAGFEMGSGIIVNSVSPEFAAKYYRSR